MKKLSVLTGVLAVTFLASCGTPTVETKLGSATDWFTFITSGLPN
jgi:hypothetical protein